MADLSLLEVPDEMSFLVEKNIHVMRLLGKGSFSEVYLSRVGEVADNRTKLVATKVINKDQVSQKFVEKFLPRELDVLLKLKHQFVISVHSIYQRNNMVYVNMEYAGNGDMFNFLKTTRLSEPQMRSWLSQILWAFQYMHHIGVVHRDLKCENILVTGSYNVRIADFGFARFVSTDWKMRPNTICGTRPYMAPELLLAANAKTDDPRPADVWAIGVVLFAMANNRLPFTDTGKEAIIQKQQARDYSFRNILGRSESLKTFTATFLEPNAQQRTTVTQALQNSWITDGHIETPSSVRIAFESVKVENSLRNPIISNNTLTNPLFSLELDYNIKSISEFNENFTDIHKPNVL